MKIQFGTKIKSQVFSLLTFVLGIFYFYMIYSFLADIGGVYSVLLRAQWNSVLMALLVIVISGFGIFLGLTCLFVQHLKAEAIGMLLAYSVLLLAANFYFTAVPGMSTCHCISFKEYIWSVKDWSRVELSLLLFLLNIAFAAAYSKKWDTNAMNAKPVSWRILSKLHQFIT